MEVAVPMHGSTIDCYEDMFKEITRKLYGEDGLPELGANDRLTSTNQDRGLSTIDYDVDNPILKSEEQLTAFGLAALMQNGFPPSGILSSGLQAHKLNTGVVLGSVLEDKWISSEESLHWTQSKIATYNPSHKLFRCTECDCVGYLLRVAEHWLGTHSTVRAFHCSQCPYESAWARCVRIHLSRQHNINTDESCDTLIKDNPILQEIIKYLQRLKNKLENIPPNEEIHNETVTSNTNISNTNQLGNSSSINNDHNNTTTKRYSCTFCPYATDRRDLFTRHENIHREEKPFQCYVCQKQFNRADHVKKHFLRMHRDHPYDLNRIRRHPPKNSSGMSYYHKYNSNLHSQSDSTNSLPTINSLSIPGFNNMTRSVTNSRVQQFDAKNMGKITNGTKSEGKRKGEKRFTCCYCSWSGVDNWCLKRHMNTHLKPFVCGLCDYKAARSERLATHVLKVHNKRACGKCNYFADDLTLLSVHQREQHSLENKNRSSNNNVLRINSSNLNGNASESRNNSIANSDPSCSQGLLKSHDLTSTAALLQRSTRLLQTEAKSWKSHISKQHGAARLFSYMEASDESDQEPNTRPTEELNKACSVHNIQSDFCEAGDVGKEIDEENGGEMELPLFVCPTCGCEFEDDMSLETHQYMHRHSTASPAKTDDSKENVNPEMKYRCRLCEAEFGSQCSIMAHMSAHSSLCITSVIPSVIRCNRSRKQSQPKKIVLPFWDSDEVEVLRHLNSKLRKWRGAVSTSKDSISKLVDKYMAQLVTRRGLICIWCKNSGLSRYHTKGSLALHYHWRHCKRKYKCEHCHMVFRHRYQCVLHSSRVHINRKPQLIPTVFSKEPGHITLASESVCSVQDTNHFFSNSHTVYVPDHTMTNAQKLGMSFFDHSFIHSTSVNNHMPIIIPTFPPN